MIDSIINEFDKLGIIPHTLPNAIGLWPNEQECLVWGATQCLSNLNFLEIGSFCGGSAILLGLTKKAFNDTGVVVSVDINFKPIVDFNIKRSQLGNILKVTCDSRYVLRYYNNPISFAFIDGWHSFSGIMHDWEAVSSIISDDGIIMFHDVSPKMWQHNQEYIDQCYDYVVHNWNSLISDKEQNFRLDEAISFLCKKFNYEIINIPVRKPLAYYKETGLGCWIRGRTSPHNAIAAIRKKQ